MRCTRQVFDVMMDQKLLRTGTPVAVLETHMNYFWIIEDMVLWRRESDESDILGCRTPVKMIKNFERNFEVCTKKIFLVATVEQDPKVPLRLWRY